MTPRFSTELFPTNILGSLSNENKSLRFLERSAKTMVESEVNWKQMTDFQLFNKVAIILLC